MIAEIDPKDLIWISVTLALMLIGGAIVLLIVKRKLAGHNELDETLPRSFTLAQLRQMKDSGQLSPEEFQRLKDKIVQDTKRQ